jgi:hypothetical protein
VRSDPSGSKDAVRYRCRCARLKISWPNAGSTSAIRPFDFGGTGLAPVFAGEIRKNANRAHSWDHPAALAFGKINGKLRYLWRAVDHGGEIFETVLTVRRDKAAAPKLLKRVMKKYGRPQTVVTDAVCSYPAAMKRSTTAIATKLVVGSTIALRIRH